MARASGGPSSVPAATVARLPLYLRSLVAAAAEGAETVSSEQLAQAAGVNAAKVRKDLSYLGSYGTRGVGYDVEFLIFEMSRQLGLSRERSVIIAGAGNLGHALANYRGFTDRGFPVAAIIDSDASKVGEVIAGVEVRHTSEIDDIVRAHPTSIGVVATPTSAAQDVVSMFVHAGITSILNFAPALVTAPEHVTVRQVDLALELQILSFYAQRHDAPTPTGATK